MKFSDGYEVREGFKIYYLDKYLETAVSALNARDIIVADKANRETIRRHKEKEKINE